MREDWIEVELGNTCKIYQPKTIATKKLISDGKYNVYGANGIIGTYDKYNHEHSELIMTCRGATCGNIHITKPFSWINGNAMVLRPIVKNTLEINFLRYILSNKQVVQKSIGGTAQPQITRTSLSPIKIPLPPHPEQRAIVAKIEQLFSELDHGVAQLKKAQAQLKVYKQAVLKKAFEEKSKKLKLGELIEKPRYGTSKKCNKDNSGIPVLRIPNIKNGKIKTEDLKYASFEKKELEALNLIEGDILTIRSNGSIDLVGKSALISQKDINFLYAGYLIRIRTIKEQLNSKYLLYALSYHGVRVQIESKAKSTSGVNNINSKELESLIIPYFEIEEQTQIVQEIESRFSVVEQLEKELKENLQKAESLRQSILKQAFEGKLLTKAEIEACKKEKDWEPAEELIREMENGKN